MQHEVQRLSRHRQHVLATDPAVAALYPAAAGTLRHAIPFFGPYAEAEILTIGVNPSAKEFARGRGWPVKICDKDLYDRLITYFTRPTHRWFHVWGRALRMLGAAYLPTENLKLQAAHLDISPRPTLSMSKLRELGHSNAFLAMLERDSAIMIDYLAASPRARGVLIAGTLVSQHDLDQWLALRGLAGLRFVAPARTPRPASIAWAELTCGGRTLPAFYCSVSPSAQAAEQQEQLVDAVSANAAEIRRRFCLP